MRKGILGAVFAFLTAALLSSGAIAQIESTPIPNSPKPDFSSMAFLVGTWNCSETNTRRSQPYTSTITTKMDPTGYWLVSTTVMHPTPWSPTESVVEDKLTFDPANSRWIDVFTDDQGGYGASYSSGWQGGKQVIHPVNSFAAINSGNVVSSGDTTQTKMSDTKYTYTGSFKESGGRVVTLKGSCTKA